MIRSIQLDFSEASIEEAFKIAKMLAVQHDAVVSFQFNGVTCYVMKGGDTDTGIMNYHKARTLGVNVAYN